MRRAAAPLSVHLLGSTLNPSHALNGSKGHGGGGRGARQRRGDNQVCRREGHGGVERQRRQCQTQGWLDSRRHHGGMGMMVWAYNRLNVAQRCILHLPSSRGVVTRRLPTRQIASKVTTRSFLRTMLPRARALPQELTARRPSLHPFFLPLACLRAGRSLRVCRRQGGRWCSRGSTCQVCGGVDPVRDGCARGGARGRPSRQVRRPRRCAEHQR